MNATCGICKKPMKYNVPRLGAAGGFVHKETGDFTCEDQKKEGGGRVLTCVYCGHEYPQTTPSWGSQVLTDHIKVCAKHPMRELELKLKRAVKLLNSIDDPHYKCCNGSVCGECDCFCEKDLKEFFNSLK